MLAHHSPTTRTSPEDLTHETSARLPTSLHSSANTRTTSTQPQRTPNPALHQQLQPSQTIHATTSNHLLPYPQPPPPSDNYYIGDVMSLPKPSNTTRLYFHNVNGISISQPGTWDTMCSHIRDMEVDVAMLAEHKLDTQQPKVLSRLYSDSRKIFGADTFAINATSTSIRAQTPHKPGGVMTLLTGDIKGRVLENGHDPHGRWVYTKLRRATGPPITVITTYQVIDTNPKQAGPTTYATQLFAAYTHEKRSEPHKLRHHHANDLQLFVQECQNNGDWVMVAGDFNEVIGVSLSGLSRLASDCGLVDAFLERHNITHFTTYQRGNQVIDYLLVDPRIMDCVVSIGYEPFNYHIMSDHRGLYMDLSTSHCFGTSIQPLLPPQLRDLSTKRSHQITPYFESKHKHLRDHNWFHKISTLQQHMEQNQPNDTLAEDLYQRLISASQYGGSRLKKFPPAPYSPTIARLRNIQRLLKLTITQLKTKRDMSANIQRTKAKLGDAGFKLPDTLEACQRELTKCTTQLKATIKDETATRHLRLQHQNTLIQTHEAAGNTKLAKKIRGMQRAEEVKRVFQRCKTARHMNTAGGLGHVLAPVNPTDDPKTCTNWKRIDDPEAVQSILQQRNREHFGQSRNCTLTSHPLDFTMKFTATCPQADAILDGTLLQPTPSTLQAAAAEPPHIPPQQPDALLAESIPPSADENDTLADQPYLPLHLQRSDLPELVGDLLDSFKYKTSPDAIRPNITETEYKAKLKVWDERTSTSPFSNMHLGHLKAYWAEHTLPEQSKEAHELEDKRRDILRGHLTLLNYALHFGYSYSTWKSIVNTMLEKDPGFPKIHRLRVIHLYEADYNLILGVKWRQVLHQACALQQINEGCYGSQPGKEATDAIIIRELEYEIS